MFPASESEVYVHFYAALQVDQFRFGPNWALRNPPGDIHLKRIATYPLDGSFFSFADHLGSIRKSCNLMELSHPLISISFTFSTHLTTAEIVLDIYRSIA